MRIDIPRHYRRLLVKMTSDELRAWLAKCDPRDALMMDAAFELWSQEEQIAPSAEGWRVWLMLAGRGFGKTRAGAEWIHQLAMGRPVRIALVAASIAEARAVMVEGVSGLISVARRQRVKLSFEPSLGRISWPRGSSAQLFSGDHADGLRGPEHHFAWCDELAKWREAEAAWTNLQMGLRAGPRPRALVTTTPRPMPLLTRLMEHEQTMTSRGGTRDNISLPKSFVDAMVAEFGGSRVGRQELDGELFTEVAGTLWPSDLLARTREAAVLPSDDLARFDRIVVGVDPPAGVGEGCDACGIVVVGREAERLLVLADDSVGGLGPEGWASRVAMAAERWGAALVVAEANNGGAMVASVLKAARIEVPVRLVHASRGKVARAEPIAVRFETGRAGLAGYFPELEAELGGLVAGGGYEGPGRSPDRADAMVWAMAVLGETRAAAPRIRRL